MSGCELTWISLSKRFRPRNSPIVPHQTVGRPRRAAPTNDFTFLFVGVALCGHPTLCLFPERCVFEHPEPVALLCTNVRGDHAVHVLIPLRVLIDILVRRCFITLVLH